MSDDSIFAAELGDRTPADVFPMWAPLDEERARRGLPEVTL